MVSNVFRSSLNKLPSELYLKLSYKPLTRLVYFVVNKFRNCLAALHIAARKLWRDYFASGVDGVVFIVDAVDRERFPEAKKELDVSHLRQ